MKITAQVEIDNEKIEDLFVTALEGGSNYWYDLHETATTIMNKYKMDGKIVRPQSIRFSEAIKAGEKIPVHDIEDGESLLGYVELSKVEKAFALMQEKYPDHFADVINDNADAITADVFFQLCVMGEVIYG